MKNIPTKKDYQAWFNGIYTGSGSIEETIENCKEALALHYTSMENNNNPITKPSKLNEIETNDILLVYLPVNLNWKASEINSFTLPKWLNQKGT